MDAEGEEFDDSEEEEKHGAANGEKKEEGQATMELIEEINSQKDAGKVLEKAESKKQKKSWETGLEKGKEMEFKGI